MLLNKMKPPGKRGAFFSICYALRIAGEYCTAGALNRFDRNTGIAAHRAGNPTKQKSQRFTPLAFHICKQML